MQNTPAAVFFKLMEKNKKMKRIISFCFLFAFAATAFAQKETFDLVTYSPPTGWNKEVTETITSYTNSNKKNNSWCRIFIVKSTTSKGSIEQDFESEWQDLIVKNYNPTGTPQLEDVQELDGWKIKAGTGKFTFNNNDAVVMLSTASGFDQRVSIVVTTNSADYLKTVETFISSIELKKPDAQNPQKKISNNNVPVAGTWGFGNNAMMANNRYGPWNYSKQQYTFNSDGTYNFIRKTYRENDAETLLTIETGIYTISGATLAIIPKKNVIEAWSKKNGGDNYNKLVSSQSQTIEKSNYSFYIYYDETLKITALMLQTSTETKRDGKYNAEVESKKMWRYLQAPGYIVIKLPVELTTVGTQNEPVKQTAMANNDIISGIWSKTSSARVASGDPAGEGAGGYTKDQYAFNSNGTYSFVSKTFRMNMNKLILVKENGTYVISGTTLTIDPKNSVTQSWSKSGGVDKWGSLLSSQNRALEKASYTFTKHYFSGIGIWNLVLQSNKPTVREGAFSNNTTFKNAWYFSPISSNNPVIELPGN